MSDLPEKAPVKHEQKIERSKTVDGLLYDTMRGATPVDRPWSIASLSKPADGAWQQYMQQSHDALQKRSQDSTGVEGHVQNKVLLAQLSGLDKLTPPERSKIISGLVDNEKNFSAIEESATTLKNGFRAGYMPALTEIQRKIISSTDLINQKALSFEVNSIKNVARDEQGDPAAKAILDKALEEARSAMAAPFIERARLSAFLINDKKMYQAERSLDEAVKTQIPSEALASSFVKELVKNSSEQLTKLKVENHLLEAYDANLQKLEISPKDGLITQNELNAAKAQSSDTTLQALAVFLSDNYKYLTRKHFALFGKDGISRADIVDYDKEHAKSMNDLDL